MSIPYLAATLIERRPKTILDAGMGFGMAGAAVRQWLEGGVKPWDTFITGVEVWPGNRSPLWDLYDVVHVTRIEDFLVANTDRFDLVILGDVIEHLAKPQGFHLLEKLESVINPHGAVLVATPHGEMPQGAAHGNPYEVHYSAWYPEDFVSRGYQILLSEDDHQIPPALPTLIAMFAA